MAIKRRLTSHVQVFTRKGPQAVIYDLSEAPHVTITVPVSSTWTSGPHWHETHTEHLQIMQGAAIVRLGDRPGRPYGTGDGVIEVPRYTVHEWHRVPPGDGDEEDLVVREWTVPEDGQKEAFFRMLNSFLTEDDPRCLYKVPTITPVWLRRMIGRWVIVLQLFSIFREWDNWPVLVGDNGGGWLSWSLTHAVLYACSWFGAVLGLQGIYIEYIGEELVSRAQAKKQR